MRKDSNIIIRVDSSLKGNVMKILEKKGYTLSDAINAFLKDVERKGQLPINLNKYLPTPKHEGAGLINIAFIKMCVEDIINRTVPNKVHKVYLFGSYARGEQKSSSDVDLRMETKEPIGLIKIGAIRQQLVDVLGKEVDLIVSHTKELDPIFYESIKKDQICIWDSSNK